MPAPPDNPNATSHFVPADDALPAPKAYQVKVLLLQTRPPVRRKLHVLDATLAELSAMVNAAIGWPDHPLYTFESQSDDYADPSRDPEWDGTDAREVRLSQLVADDETFLTYTLDETWRHALKIERVFPADPKGIYPRCISGKGVCPAEIPRESPPAAPNPSPLPADRFDLEAANRRLREILQM